MEMSFHKECPLWKMDVTIFINTGIERNIRVRLLDGDRLVEADMKVTWEKNAIFIKIIYFVSYYLKPV